MLHHLESVFLMKSYLDTHQHTAMKQLGFIGGHLRRCKELGKVHWSKGRWLVGLVGRRAVVGKTDFY